MPSIYVPMKNRSLMVKKEKEPISQSKYFSDSDSSDDNDVRSKPHYTSLGHSFCYMVANMEAPPTREGI